MSHLKEAPKPSPGEPADDTPEQCLLRALAAVGNLNTVQVLAYDSDGNLVTYHSRAGQAKRNWQLDTAKARLMGLLS